MISLSYQLASENKIKIKKERLGSKMPVCRCGRHLFLPKTPTLTLFMPLRLDIQVQFKLKKLNFLEKIK
jgi:hypothetical protein